MAHRRDISALTVIRTTISVAIPIYFILSSEHFLSSGNLFALFQSVAFIGLMALGISLTLIAGEFDLGVGAMAALSGLITLKLDPSNLILGVVASVLVGVLVGCFNTFMVLKVKASSLVVTLGTSIALTGVGFAIIGDEIVRSDDFDTNDVVTAPILSIFSLSSLVMVGIYVLVALTLRYTRLGRNIYATGSDRNAAVSAGVPVGRTLFTVFCASGVFAAISGSLLALTLASATATLDMAPLLIAISAAILGGVALRGGVGTPVGVAVGVFVLAALQNGLSLLSASSAAGMFANGGLLLIVVLLEGDLFRIFSDMRNRTRGETASRSAAKI